jgi:hypothetical protein
VIVGLRNRAKLVAKRLKIAIYIGLQWEQNLHASVVGLEWKERRRTIIPPKWRATKRPLLLFLWHSDSVVDPTGLLAVSEVECLPPAV